MLKNNITKKYSSDFSKSSHRDILYGFFITSQHNQVALHISDAEDVRKKQLLGLYDKYSQQTKTVN